MYRSSWWVPGRLAKLLQANALIAQLLFACGNSCHERYDIYGLCMQMARPVLRGHRHATHTAPTRDSVLAHAYDDDDVSASCCRLPSQHACCSSMEMTSLHMLVAGLRAGRPRRALQADQPEAPEGARPSRRRVSRAVLCPFPQNCLTCLALLRPDHAVTCPDLLRPLPTRTQ